MTHGALPYRTTAQHRRDEIAWLALVSGAADLANDIDDDDDPVRWPERCRFCGDVADTPDPSAETEMVCAYCADHGPCAQDRDDYR